MKVIANPVEVPQGRHFGILETTDTPGQFTYSTFESVFDYSQALEKLVLTRGTGNIAGLCVEHAANFVVKIERV